MVRAKKIGYDTYRIYKKCELEDMYLAEGKSPEEAAKLAAILYTELNRLRSKERRFWKHVREHEKTGHGLLLGEEE